MTNPSQWGWEAVVLESLRRLGGEAHLSALTAKVEEVRREKGLPFSITWKATIRRVVQQSSAITQEVKRSGIWRLKDRAVTLPML